jgi:hypothetical protein
MLGAIAVAANMCLQGGEQVDISKFVAPNATMVELRVKVKSPTGALLVYSPGYEAQPARFTEQASFGMVPIAEPVLCLKGVGGPFDFDITVLPTEYDD